MGDCSSWNMKASHNGHSYQFAPEAVKYYIKHMTGHVSGRNDKVPARRCDGAKVTGCRLDVSRLNLAGCVSWLFAFATNMSRVVQMLERSSPTCDTAYCLKARK